MAREVPDWLRRAREGWAHKGGDRPPFAEEPGPGQESVWDYPRPPKLVPDPREVVVRASDVELARTRGALKLCETASPPTFYLPPADVRSDLLERAAGASFCEWKGEAQYWSVVAGEERLEGVAWTYPNPFGEYAPLAGFFAFYPARVECFVAGERVRPQPGRFYGGWITDDVVGPFKGEPGTGGW